MVVGSRSQPLATRGSPLCRIGISKPALRTSTLTLSRGVTHRLGGDGTAFIQASNFVVVSPVSDNPQLSCFILDQLACNVNFSESLLWKSVQRCRKLGKRIDKPIGPPHQRGDEAILRVP